MNLIRLIQEATPAALPKEGGGEAQQSPWVSLVPFAVMALLFYFILLAPQRKQQKKREELLKGLKKNDHVLLQSGIFGIVQSVKDHEVTVLIDEKRDVRIRVARSAVIGIEKSAGGEGEPAEKLQQELRQ